MSHVCHAIKCEKDVPPKMFMCGRHWKRLHPTLQKLVWRYYEPGQEIRKVVSLEYIMVTDFAKLYIANLENHSNTEQDLISFHKREAMLIEKGCSSDLYRYLKAIYDMTNML